MHCLREHHLECVISGGIGEIRWPNEEDRGVSQKWSARVSECQRDRKENYIPVDSFKTPKERHFGGGGLRE